MKVELKMIGDIPAIITDDAVSPETAAEMQAWIEAARHAPRAFLGTERGVAENGEQAARTGRIMDRLKGSDAWADVWEAAGLKFGDPDESLESMSARNDPREDWRTAAARANGAAVDPDGRYVIKTTAEGARGIVHAIGHLEQAHIEVARLLLESPILGALTLPAIAAEFAALGNIRESLVALGIERVEVAGDD